MQTKQSSPQSNKPNAWILESKVNSGEQEEEDTEHDSNSSVCLIWKSE